MMKVVFLMVTLALASPSWARPYLGEPGNVESLPWKMYVTTDDKTRILWSFKTAEDCWMAEDIAEAVKADLGVEHASYLVVCSQSWTEDNVLPPKDHD